MMKGYVTVLALLISLTVVCKGQQINTNPLVLAPKGYVYLTDEQFRRAEQYKLDAMWYRHDGMIKDTIIAYQAKQLAGCSNEIKVNQKIIKKLNWKLILEFTKKWGGWAVATALAGKQLKIY